MTKKHNSKVYAPKIRSGYRPAKHSLISYGKTIPNYSRLPSPVTDDIVCNNITYMEFDYIGDPVYTTDFEDQNEEQDDY